MEVALLEAVPQIAAYQADVAPLQPAVWATGGDLRAEIQRWHGQSPAAVPPEVVLGLQLRYTHPSDDFVANGDIINQLVGGFYLPVVGRRWL